MSELRILDGSGDTKLMWDKNNPDEVAAAKKTFDDLLKKKHVAFSVKKSGKTGKQITEFDPEAEKIIMSPQIVGG